MTSTLEELFAFQATAAGLPAFEREVCAIPGRKFRFDFAWPAYKLLVEVNGGTFTRGAHSTGVGIERDMEKLDLATLAGWRVLQVSAKMVRSGVAVEMVRQALEAE